MSRYPARLTLGILCVSLLSSVPVLAGGVTFGLPLFTLDVEGTLAQLPVAIESALEAIELAAIDLGIPPADLSSLQTNFDAVLADIQDTFDELPLWVPVPLLGGGIEFDLPFILLDGIRLSGGLLSDRLVRSLAGWGGFNLPQPLLDMDLALGETQGSVTADVAFSLWALSTEVIKHLDVWLFAVNLGAGVDLAGGRIVPTVDYELPPEMASGAATALDALHLDELTWSAFAVHGMIGFELGPPFLRLYGDIRWTVPLSQDVGWWNIRLGPVSALLGFVIRY